MEFIKNCFKSLYDFRAYKKLSKESGIKAALYVIVLSVILGALVAIPVASGLKDDISVIENNADKIPEFAVKNNVMDLQNDKSVVLRSNNTFLIFDENSDNNEDYKKAKNAVLWGKTQYKVKKDGQGENVTKYSEIKGLTLNKDFVLKQVKTYKMIPFKGLIQNVVIAYMLIIMTSLIIMTFKAKMNNPMKFKEIFKISSFAVTAPIILFTCLIAFGIGNIPIVSWILVIIQALYVRKAIRVIQGKDDNKAVDKKKKQIKSK